MVWFGRAVDGSAAHLLPAWVADALTVTAPRWLLRVGAWQPQRLLLLRGVIKPKLRGPADVNADSDLGKRWVREAGVLAARHCPARHPGRPLMINLISRLMIARFLATFSGPKLAPSQFRPYFQATRRRNLRLSSGSGRRAG
jgi:hypothetical protein